MKTELYTREQVLKICRELNGGKLPSNFDIKSKIKVDKLKISALTLNKNIIEVEMKGASVKMGKLFPILIINSDGTNKIIESDELEKYPTHEDGSIFQKTLKENRYYNMTKFTRVILVEIDGEVIIHTSNNVKGEIKETKYLKFRDSSNNETITVIGGDDFSQIYKAIDKYSDTTKILKEGWD